MKSLIPPPTPFLKRLTAPAAALLALPLLSGPAAQAAGSTTVASFASTSSGRAENGGPHDVRVNFSPAPTAELMLKYTVETDERWPTIEGTDFRLLSQNPVVVPANSTHVNIRVETIDDAEWEALESVKLVLTDTDDYDLGPAPWHVMFIDDDEVDLVQRIRDMLRREDGSLDQDSKTRWKRVLKALGPDKVDLAGVTPMTHSAATMVSGDDAQNGLWKEAVETLRMKEK